MKKKNLFLGVLLASAAFGLAACQGNGNSTTSGTTPTTTQGVTPTTSSTTPDADPTTSTTNTGDPSTPEDTSYVKMGNKEYATIAAALADVPTSNDTGTYVITLGKGTYNENGLAYEGTATVHIKGDTTTKYGADVIIKGHGSDMKQEKTRNLISVRGTGNIILENLTLESDWTRTGAAAAGMASNTQAEVLGTDTKGNTVAYNCSFKSHQDTLRTAGKAWFYGCYIEGDVDFIWMEQAGSVALYEKCEIVSVYDSTASTHASYVAAPRMAKSTKVGKGLVIYNSTVKESEEARTNGQETFICRNPWSSTTDYFNQVAYINTTCQDIQEALYKGAATVTEYDPLAIGWKMDQATATSLGYAGNGDILDADTVSKEFNGRKTIINRVYNAQKQKYEKDTANNWDIDALIKANNWTVDTDASSDTLDSDTAGDSTTYKFDGSTDLSSYMTGFTAHSSGSVQGGAGATITVPVNGKSYVEVYGFYSGTVDVKADTQEGSQIMFFNNNSTGAEVLNTYVVYDATATSVTLTVEATTYITKIVVTEDTSIEEVKTESITVSASTTTECVGVPLSLSAAVNPKTSTNKSVYWTSSADAVGKVDKYTGKVTFVSEGEVTFTAHACDGSGVTGSITCHPVNPVWTVAEWYTTDDVVATETGATEIKNYNPNSSTYKNLTKSYTFTNVAGTSITTSKGLKLNSAGKLSISTTKGNATLTVVIATENGQLKAAPLVHAGTTNATLLSTTVNADTSTTYVFEIPSAGTWDIERGDTQSENNPIIYAKCEYDLTISKSTFVNFKGGTYKATDGSVSLNHNEGDIQIAQSTTPITFDNITYTGVRSNGANNWLVFPAGGTIEFTAKSACQLYISFYQANTCKVTLDGTEITTASDANPYLYEIPAGGKVVIESINGSNSYLGYFEVIFPAQA